MFGWGSSTSGTRLYRSSRTRRKNKTETNLSTLYVGRLFLIKRVPTESAPSLFIASVAIDQRSQGQPLPSAHDQHLCP